MNTEFTAEVYKDTSTGQMILHYYAKFAEAEFYQAISQVVQSQIKEQMKDAANVYFGDIIKEQVRKGLSEAV